MTGDSRAGPGPVAATAWVAARLGAPTDVLEVRTIEVGSPGPGQARVATEAISLDFNDIDTIRGRYALLPFDHQADIHGMPSSSRGGDRIASLRAFRCRPVIACLPRQTPTS